MHAGLTQGAAAELGRQLKFLRHATGRTLADVAARANISVSYLQNLEGGARTNAAEERVVSLAHGYGIDEAVLRDLLLRAQILSALERHGLTPEQRDFIWRGVSQRMAEQGFDLRTDLGRVISDLLSNGGERR